VDIGKIVHYNFDKLTYQKEPTQKNDSNLISIKEQKNKKFEIDQDDFPYLRARPTWVSPEESEISVQHEINIFAEGMKSIQTIGRSQKKDIQIKLKAVSGDHC
jgi:hypothetical protein